MNSDDIKALAALSRISITQEEEALLARDMSAILQYVQDIKNVTGDVSHSKESDAFVTNSMREDVVCNPAGMYTDSILAGAPDSDKGYVRVKKILSYGDSA